MSIIIGITGGSGSGKTFLLEEIYRSFQEGDVTIISQDNYYKDRSLQPVDEKGVKNFDTPDSIDHKRFVKDITRLKNGQVVELKSYTFNNPNAESELIVLNPAPIIIVEGIFVQYFETIRNMLDLKVFIEASDHIKIKRRIYRDAQERGYDLDDVLYRYEHHVAPTYQKYIEPGKQESDLIIPNDRHMAKAIEVLVAYLKSQLA